MTEILWVALNVDEDPEEMRIFLTYSVPRVGRNRRTTDPDHELPL